jgi:WD40 repeat protein
LNFLKRFGPSAITKKGEKEKNRILSVCFGDDDSVYVGGVSGIYKYSSNFIYLYHIPTEGMIWDLIFIKNTLIAAESDGSISFCDSQKGIVDNKQQLNNGDILRLSKSQNENYVVATGCDSTINIFQKIVILLLKKERRLEEG